MRTRQYTTGRCANGTLRYASSTRYAQDALLARCPQKFNSHKIGQTDSHLAEDVEESTLPGLTFRI